MLTKFINYINQEQVKVGDDKKEKKNEQFELNN